MTGGKISENKARCFGGGIAVYGGTVEISGGTIKNNRAAAITYGSSPYDDVGGGGIYVEKGTVNFKDGTIRENFLDGAKKNCGAGVFIDAGGTFNMSGGSITDCKPNPDVTTHKPSKGGGVYVRLDGKFIMNGGTISGNQATDGGGVYIHASQSEAKVGSFMMKGSAIVTPSIDNAKGNNDVYLHHESNYEASIIVTGGLTSPSTVARLTMYNPNTPAGNGYYPRVVVKGEGIDVPGGHVLSDYDVSLFKVTPGGSPQKNWKVVKDGNAGKLKIDP